MDWDETERQLKQRIREKRGAQAEIARRLGIKAPSVAGYVTGTARIPLDHLNTIREVLEIEYEIPARE